MFKGAHTFLTNHKIHVRLQLVDCNIIIIVILLTKLSNAAEEKINDLATIECVIYYMVTCLTLYYI